MPEPIRALSPAERDAVHHTFNTERFANQAPREDYATLLDEGTYLCSPSTMYRVLAEHTKLLGPTKWTYYSSSAAALSAG